MTHTHDPALVTTSVLVAMLASYVALDLAGRVAAARGRARAGWLAGGSVAMGGGIWSMHFIAMMAFALPVPIAYDVPLVLLSIVAAIAASAVALFTLCRGGMGWPRLLGAGLLMGAAVAGMHYTGMAAMRLAAEIHYDPALVAASVAVAVAASVAALWIASQLRHDRGRSALGRRAGAAVVMGVAIAGMHYTGMAAAHFTERAELAGIQPHGMVVTSGLTGVVVAVTLLVLGIAVVSSLVDRALQRHVADAAAASLLAAIVESSSDAIDSKSLEGVVVSWNAAAERLYGYQAHEILGQPITLLAGPDGTAEIAAQLERVGRGERIENFETVRRRKDGALIDVSVTLSPITSSPGQITGISTIARDITERRRVDAELRQHARHSALAAEVAEAATRAKSEFLANMSHEIRTPMNGVVGMLELALDGALAAEQREYLEVARSSADALLTVINDILDFSKIEAGRLELAPAPFGLRDALGDAVRAVALHADDKGLELALHVLPEVPDGLVGDAGRLRQVVVNLVGNAIKFTHRGEVVVTVETVPRDGDAAAGAPGEAGAPALHRDDVVLHVAVRDTGVGIAPEKQQLIFGAFQQADSSTTREFGGTGLGLAISSQLVALMGGRIWVESEVGRGSTFHFTARLERHGRRAGTPIGAAAVRPPALRGLRVLVVDDNATNRRILEQTLANWGMHPTPVDGGAAALAALRTARAEGASFQLVLLDANMPGMDGFQFAAHIRDCPELRGATVMMLSSAGQQREATRCRELEIAAYLTKPVRASDLLKSISTVLGAAATPAGPTVAARSQTAIEPGGRLLRVLLVDDNAVNRRLGVALLERRGHSVAVAENGQLALEAIGRESFDVVLMDVHMPVMGGFEATAAIRAQEQTTGAHLPVVAMTARAMSGDRELCLAAGMDAYVAKPIQPTELFEVVEQLAGRRGARSAADRPDVARRSADRDARDDEAPDAGVFDRHAFHGIAGGDEQLMRELVDIFLSELPEMRAAIRAAVAQSDLRALESAAHALKGAVGSLAAAHAFAAALTLETLARQGRAAGVDAALATFEVELARLERVLSTPLAVTA